MGEASSITKKAQVDLLFVIDNSGSMGAHQARLASAFQSFSTKYLQPSGVAGDDQFRDLRMASITTDTYSAGHVGGYSIDAATLKPGFHDGQFPIKSSTLARSGMPVLGTTPPSGTPADAAWFSKLTNDFKINVAPGTSGLGSESGMSSVKRFIEVNENSAVCRADRSSPQCLFRPGSYRVLFFFSDSIDVCAPLNATDNPTGKGAAPEFCPHASVRVSQAKSALDTLFKEIDGTDARRYFTVSTVSTADTGYNDAGALPESAVAVHYDDLTAAIKGDASNPIGSFSFQQDLVGGDITAALDRLGTSIDTVATRRVTAYELERPPEALEYLKFTINSGAGKTTVPAGVLKLTGKHLELDSTFVQQFSPESVLEGCYYPANTRDDGSLAP